MPSNFRKLMPTVLRPFVVFDSFNRADGELGNADTGQTWAKYGGSRTVNVLNNQVASSGSRNLTKVGIEVGITNIIMSALVVNRQATTRGTGLVFRMIDRYNYAYVFNNTISPYYWEIGQVVDGVITIIYSTNIGSLPNDFLWVRLFGNEITLKINGIQVYSEIYPDLLSGTKCGLCFIAEASVYDNFLVEAL